MAEAPETVPVTVCRECATHWYPQAGPPGCSDPAHTHVTHALHRHRTRVVLPNGAAVLGVSFDPSDPYERATTPDFGLYLDPRWQPPWPHELLEWPDFGLPATPALCRALRSLHERAQAGQRVEIGCLGGHGRTGTALGVLAVATGCPPGDGVAWVRAHYCPEAIETEAQGQLVGAAPLNLGR
jgi:hypothetical protein